MAWVYQRFPAASRCNQCGRNTLKGWHDGLVLNLDHDRISPKDEVISMLLGLNTFHLLDPHIYKRNLISRATRPVPPYGNIYREHRCSNGVPIMGLPPPRYRDPLPDEPPF